jgi:hypothetical protein
MMFYEFTLKYNQNYFPYPTCSLNSLMSYYKDINLNTNNYNSNNSIVCY